MSYTGPYPLPIKGGGTAQTTSPCFSAYLNTGVTNQTGDGTTYTILFDTKLVDTTTSYNTGTGLFTAPVTGNYLFSANITAAGLAVANTTGAAPFVTNAGINYYFTYSYVGLTPGGAGS